MRLIASFLAAAAASAPSLNAFGMSDRCPQFFFELVDGQCIAEAWKDSVSFDANVQLCLELTSTLPSIVSDKENSEYAALLAGNPLKSKWMWLDRTPFTYSNFDDPIYDSSLCYPKSRKVFSLEIGGKWYAQDTESAMKEGVCVMPAGMSIPTSAPVYCDEGWESIDGACFKFDISKKKLSLFDAEKECQKMQASLPSIIRWNQNVQIFQIVRYLSAGKFQFWIGLQCGTDGNFAWLDGTAYSYNNLLPPFSICTNSANGYAFAYDGHWIENNRENGEAEFLACSKSGYSESVTKESATSEVLTNNIPLAAGKSIFELTTLNNENDLVAVKMLHENADISTDNDFKAEIELMKKIGYHERIVNLLACVTQSEPILLIIEYCANGDLLQFMRNRLKYMLEHSSNCEENKIITAKQRIMFAIQVAYGLEYLATRGFLHRDIAARNIMVDHQETCKIGDFGLCRATGRENENYHAQGKKLPIKWMSLEAIDKYIFSTASDVWSFGILLFEIVTLGGTPYAGWPTSELLNRLNDGERMARPDDCSEELFDVMLHCWAEIPSDRPTFTKLRKRLGVLFEDIDQDNYYLKPNAQANYYAFDSETT